MLLLSLLGCIVEKPLPHLGDCAVYPDGVYEYGEIGLGTCLSGPTELRIAEGDDGSWTVLVTNANPQLNFTGGSLLAIPWDEIDLSVGKNILSEMAVTANSLPTFAGPLTLVDDDKLALVGVRFSEEARTRVYDDRVHLFDLTDPSAPTPAPRGPGGAETVTVESDPIDIAYDASTGYAYVANRTDHTVSVLDTNGDEIAVIQPWPAHAISASTFDDVDGSGSTAELAYLEEINDDEVVLIDETWTLTWIAGTWRLWVPEDGALRRLTTAGDGNYTAANEIELDPEDDALFESIQDPFYLYTVDGRMYFVDETAETILSAAPGDFSTAWEASSAVMGLRDSAASINGPAVVVSDSVYWLFFGEDDGDVGDIRLAASSAPGAGFSRIGAVLSPTHAHEGSFIGQPAVAYDVQTDQWRMYYSAFDGAQWTIGYATSDDLGTWTASEAPVFAIDGEDVGAPAISFEAGAYKMWFARGTGDQWTLWTAESEDGLNWTPIAEVDSTLREGSLPPRAALLASPTASFRVAGETTGTQTAQLYPGSTTAFADYGWAATPLAGMWLTPGDAGADSSGGIRVDHVDNDAGLFWTTLTTTGGTPSIGAGYLESDGSLLPLAGAVYAGGEAGYDRDGASSPVLWEVDGVRYMAYGAHRNGVISIGLASSTDGFTWTPEEQLLDNGASWDSVSAVPGSIDVLSDGTYRLWYAGFDGGTWRIGALVSDNGLDWSRESTEPVLLAGSPGDWDDSGVRHPYVITDDAGLLTGEAGEHMWYAGFDSDTWRIGYAFRAAGSATWVRAEDPISELKRPVIDETLGLFHPTGVQRPVVSMSDEGDLEVWYDGRYGDEARAGRAVGQQPDRLYKTPLRPTVGDTLTFQTQRGDADAEAIPLDTDLLDVSLSGVGLTALDVDEERGFLYVSSKLLPYITVIDIRDDSTTEYDDLNYLDVEAVLLAKTFTSTSGFRQVIPVPGEDTLYALNDAPESVMLLDVSELEDDAYPQLMYDIQKGWLPAPTASRDDGVATRSDVGPAQLVVHPDGRRLLVSNFNANSITVYDLELGPYGTLVGEVPLVGENPYSMALTPDGRYAVFGNFSGEVTDTLVESTIGILDVDPESPTYLSVLTWIANR